MADRVFDTIGSVLRNRATVLSAFPTPKPGRWVFFAFFMVFSGGCAPAPVVSEPTLEPSTAAPIPSATAIPTVTASPTVTLTPTRTPFPEAYDRSLWTISMDSAGWESIDFVVELEDGAILAIGRAAEKDAVSLVKLSEAGQVLWYKEFSLSPDIDLQITSAAPNAGGGAFVTGTLSGQNQADDLAVIFRLDADGGIEWIQTAKGTILDRSDTDRLLMSTPHNRPGFQGSEMSIRSLTSEGELDRSRSLILEAPEGTGGGPVHYMLGAHLLEDSSILVNGANFDYVPTYGDSERGQTDGSTVTWFARIDASNQVVWKRYFRFVWPPIAHHATTSDHGLVTAGMVFREGNRNDAYSFALKVDSEGRIVFQRRFLDLFRLYGVSPTSDGGVLLFGSGPGEIRGYEDGQANRARYGQARLVKIDAGGQQEWARGYSEGVVLEAVEQLNDGSLLLSWWNWRTSTPAAALSRIGSDGTVLGCPDLALSDIAVRGDEAIPKGDFSNTVTFDVQELASGPGTIEIPAIELTDSSLEITELCRFVP